MLPIAVDVMGGDKGPAEIIAGARQAAETLGVPVVLIGQAEAVVDAGGLEVWPATEVIDMGDDPLQGVRRKKDASMVRAAEAVRDGKASAMVSAGNTGAVMASALLRMGRISGVARPAIATMIPVPGSTPTVLLDSGANAECTPAWLLQFAQMGAAYAVQRLGKPEPLVGLLSIGEEPSKGNELVKEAHGLLAAAGALRPGRFVGNVEGRDVLTDAADVVVTDGFTGNVVLKTLEGSVRVVVDALLGVMSATEEARAAAKVLLPALLPLQAELDPDTYGGALLLGVNGVCIISHGSSSARAIVNAVGLAAEMVAGDLVGRIGQAVRPG
ncbi:MAG TPA: phosphate acyltransferase PlsX [Acidimicrobiales bacterium]|jgi:glycerol-3-phosphate acyltransferase PlsX|nr:phosphate acyltransferase PlsX [Acidimicrobiales bacterium]